MFEFFSKSKPNVVTIVKLTFNKTYCTARMQIKFHV